MFANLLILMLTLGLSKSLIGQDIYSNNSLREQYIENSKNNRSLYGSSPITHITPSFNTIAYALGLELPNYTISPDFESAPNNRDDNRESSLELTGWAARPHIAVSLRNFGLGFSLGRSMKKASYSQLITSTNQQTKQESILESGEVGLFAYLVPFAKINRKLRATVILGGRSINAKHSYPDPYSSLKKSIKRYNVSVLQLGLNLKFQLFRRFSITPWADYQYVDTRSIESEARNEAPTEQQSQLENDLLLFWHDQPQFRYGIDFGTRIGRFDINLGGLLGSLITTANKKDSIDDSSITINLSFNHKGN